MRVSSPSLLVSLAATLLLTDNSQGYSPRFKGIDGMEERDGDLYFHGQRVKSIQGIGDDGKQDVVNLEEILNQEEVIKKEPVASQQEVSKLEPVSRMDEVLSQQPVESLEEVKEILPILSMEEVLKLEDIINKYEIDDAVAKQFIQREGLKPLGKQGYRGAPASSSSGGPETGADRSDVGAESPSGYESEIDELKEKLQKTLGEITSIDKVLRKMEIKHLEEVQNMREVKNMEEIKRMDEIRNMEELKKMEEVVRQEEILNKQLIKSMQPVTKMEEVVKKWELTDKQVQDLRNRIRNAA